MDSIDSSIPRIKDMAGITIRDDPLGKGPVLPLWAIAHCGVKSMSVGSRWVVLGQVNLSELQFPKKWE